MKHLEYLISFLPELPNFWRPAYIHASNQKVFFCKIDLIKYKYLTIIIHLIVLLCIKTERKNHGIIVIYS